MLGHIRQIRASCRLSPLLFACDADRPTSFLVHSGVLPAPGAKHLATLRGFQLTTSQWIIFESVAARVEPLTARRTGVVVFVVADVSVRSKPIARVGNMPRILELAQGHVLPLWSLLVFCLVLLTTLVYQQLVATLRLSLLLLATAPPLLTAGLLQQLVLEAGPFVFPTAREVGAIELRTTHLCMERRHSPGVEFLPLVQRTFSSSFPPGRKDNTVSTIRNGSFPRGLQIHQPSDTELSCHCQRGVPEHFGQ